MKFKFVSLSAFVIILSMFLLTSCGDKKNEKKDIPQEEAKKEIHSDHDYQCPMDCEKGKTYDEAGSCPVCKMDLKEAKQGKAMKCDMHKGGKCSCEGEKCKCKNCEEHAKAVTCEQHKDGKCSCEGEKCECKNCPEHSQTGKI